ncbi:hypothetical protein QVD17_09732 [Tagetes erecta]|uniref:Uncharacterized protein n=1 Tax=Tagetes erecta TaxID=13708 RepID=A0AAD8KZU8_TARER|nr:hypothetical protein QVD17_09732 [Tagetes erecta]
MKSNTVCLCASSISKGGRSGSARWRRGEGEESRPRDWLLVLEFGEEEKVSGRDGARKRWDEMGRRRLPLWRGGDEMGARWLLVQPLRPP